MVSGTDCFSIQPVSSKNPLNTFPSKESLSYGYVYPPDITLPEFIHGNNIPGMMISDVSLSLNPITAYIIA